LSSICKSPVFLPANAGLNVTAHETLLPAGTLNAKGVQLTSPGTITA
jgi:hypothetical protein